MNNSPIWKAVAKKIAERNNVGFDAFFEQEKGYLEKGDDIKKEIESIGKAEKELDERIESEIQRLLQK